MNNASLAAHYGLNPATLDAAPPGPVTVVNLFKLHDVAAYPADRDGDGASGLEAMLRYAAVSGERLAAVGGRFLSQGMMLGALWGDDDDWDLVVVAEYPSVDAIRALLDDPQYLDAYEHRRAAVEVQRVVLSASM